MFLPGHTEGLIMFLGRSLDRAVNTSSMAIEKILLPPADVADAT